MCGCKLSAFTQNVGLPAEVNHSPVGFVSVHGDLHSAAAGRDLDIAVFVGEIGDECFEGIDVFKRGGFAYVTAVEEDVNADILDAFSLCLLQHSLEVVDMAVHVAVGEQTDEVEGGVIGLHAADEGLPGFGCEHLAGFNGGRNQLCALSEHLTGAESVVAYFGVAHVIIRGKTDSGAVSLQGYHGIFLHDAVQIGSPREAYCVCFGSGSKTNAVHNDGQYGTDPVHTVVRSKSFHRNFLLYI